MPTDRNTRPGPANVAATLLLWAVLLCLGLAAVVFGIGMIFLASMPPR